MSMIFIKLRTKWAHGYSQWEYRFTGEVSDEALEEIIEEEADKYSYTDKFRGIDWERCVPPENVLDNYIKSAENAVDAAQRRLLNLRSYKVTLDEADGDNEPKME